MKKRNKRTRRTRRSQSQELVFGDVFAGCGGLSLGLLNAGWKGRFVVEQNEAAFTTLATNLLQGKQSNFRWPRWLPKKAMTTGTMLAQFGRRLDTLKGTIHLLAGGPPCQGFSTAGRRVHADPRNKLIGQYLRIVRKVQPRFLLVENVRGFDLPFIKNPGLLKKADTYSAMVTRKLSGLGYVVFSELLDLSQFGVPQTRRRFIIIAIKKRDPAIAKLHGQTPFDLLKRQASAFLKQKGLPAGRPVTVREAIHDLETQDRTLIESTDSPVNGFRQLRYEPVPAPSAFIRLMRKGYAAVPDSLRLPRHGADTVQKFRLIMTTCTPGKSISKEDRERLGLKKHAITPLSAVAPAATVTTLPDDMIHYSEPRILTVRENARLQTFPDCFTFTGKYTTGGSSRKSDCPRYTQVGNAVPPLFAEAVGRLLLNLAS